MLFVMIGADASTSWVPGELERDPRGYICTGIEWSGRGQHGQIFIHPYPALWLNRRGRKASTSQIWIPAQRVSFRT